MAVPDSATLRDQTPVLTDVLANDYSPRADVLVTRSVAVSSDNDWLRPSIYQGRWVRIEALDPATPGRPPAHRHRALHDQRRRQDDDRRGRRSPQFPAERPQRARRRSTTRPSSAPRTP